MSENTENQHQSFRDNKHGIATAVGVVVCIVIGLITRNDLLFGLVMGTVFGSGMNLGVKISGQLAEKAPNNLLPAKIVAAIAVGIVTALVLSIINGAVDLAPMEGDNILITIVKHFFDNTAATAMAAGVLVAGLMQGEASD